MKLEDLEYFFLKASLYEKFSIHDTDEQFLFDLLYFKQKIDCYCPSCNKESTFIGTNKSPNYSQFHLANSFSDLAQIGGIKSVFNTIIPINLHCSRNEKHIMQQIIYLSDKDFYKIGQYPSIAEISQSELKKYRIVLNEEKYKELNRGIGLITHGIGIGSFVYLRRIFEDLIEEAHQTLNKSIDWDENLYSTARMNDKIEILKNELPEFLVENKSLYGILSKGIHELTENECKHYFPTVKLGIELILDEKLELKNKKDKIAIAKKEISKIKGQLKNK